MRRSFGATLFILGCATLLSRGVCLAQITFIPGPPTSVPNGPQYAATGDFDADGLADIAISCVSSRKVTVGFGSPDGTMRIAQLQQVGRGLRGLTTADFNSDRNDDIGVTDFAVNRVFEIAYPEQLSRGLVLIKWWLLAIPQYLVLGLIGGGVPLLFRTGWGAASVPFGGFIGLLVCFAAIALLFTGRYPRGIYQFVLGLNRWVFRVVPYVALMRDEYPPFTLDQGPTEPDAPLPPPPEV